MAKTRKTPKKKVDPYINYVDFNDTSRIASVNFQISDHKEKTPASEEKLLEFFVGPTNRFIGSAGVLTGALASKVRSTFLAGNIVIEYCNIDRASIFGDCSFINTDITDSSIVGRCWLGPNKVTVRNCRISGKFFLNDYVSLAPSFLDGSTFSGKTLISSGSHIRSSIAHSVCSLEPITLFGSDVHNATLPRGTYAYCTITKTPFVLSNDFITIMTSYDDTSRIHMSLNENLFTSGSLNWAATAADIKYIPEIDTVSKFCALMESRRQTYLKAPHFAGLFDSYKKFIADSVRCIYACTNSTEVRLPTEVTESSRRIYLD